MSHWAPDSSRLVIQVRFEIDLFALALLSSPFCVVLERHLLLT